MPFDRSWTQEELGADLRVRETVTGEAGDLLLLRCEFVAYLRGPCMDPFACREQLDACSLGEGVHPGGGEQIVCRPELIAGLDPSSLLAEPFAVQQVSATQLGAHPRAAQMLDRRSE